MPVYEYTARDANGRGFVGAIEADRDQNVTLKLREMGFFITNLRRKTQPVGVGEYFARFRGISLCHWRDADFAVPPHLQPRARGQVTARAKEPRGDRADNSHTGGGL